MVDVSRRSLLGTIGAVGAAASTLASSPVLAARRGSAKAGSMFAYAAPKMDRVRCATIGLGERGGWMTVLLSILDGLDIKAVCDIDEFVLDKTLAELAAKSGIKPDRYTGDKYAYRKMLDRDDIDVVFIFTPWEWHAPMAIDAMNRGKHVFVEVPLATTIEDMWKMVETSERTQRHCMMMENCAYGREEMMVLNMVRQNVFGELLHGQGAYIHELKQQLSRRDRGEGVWRPFWQTQLRGNLYPTHGLGPVAQYMNINRGDRFDYVVAMDTPAIGMGQYARDHLPAGDPAKNWKFIAGDMSSSLIKTVKGRTILVQHDINSPLTYDRLNYIQGTKGAFGGYPARIVLDDSGKANHERKWDTDMAKYYAKYDHPLWQKIGPEAEKAGGHGGMDFVMAWRIVYALRNGLPVDQPVYDGAAWSALFDLSDKSVRKRSAPMTIPDFTRGAWQTAKSFNVEI